MRNFITTLLLLSFCIAIGQVPDTIKLDTTYNFSYGLDGDDHQYIVDTKNECGFHSVYWLDFANEQIPDEYRITTSEKVYQTGLVGGGAGYPLPFNSGFALVEYSAFYQQFMPTNFTIAGAFKEESGRVVIKTRDRYFNITTLPNDYGTNFRIRLKLVQQFVPTDTVHYDTVHVNTYCEDVASVNDTIFSECVDTIITRVFDYVQFNGMFPVISVCEGETYTLSVPEGYQNALYAWGGEQRDFTAYSDTSFTLYHYDDVCEYTSEVFVNVNAPIEIDLVDEYQAEYGKQFYIDLCDMSVDEVVLDDETVPCKMGITAYSDMTYEFIITDINGCKQDFFVDVNLIIKDDIPAPHIYFPNAFSPNGDGVNDMFTYYDNGKYIKKVCYFQVFDRWGGTVLTTNDTGQWDGAGYDNGTFVYMMKAETYKGMELFKGGVTIVR